MASIHISDTGTIQPHQNNVPSKVILTIHNQFPGIELIFPVYVGKGVTCHLSPDKIVDVGSTTQIGFNIDPDLDESTGVLMYKLNRKNTDQPNEEEAICIQLFTVWKACRSEEFWVVSNLIEHDKSRVRSRNKLMQIAKGCRAFNAPHSPIEDTWLIRDNTVLMTRVSVTREEESYKLEMTVSEGSIKDDTQRPCYIGLSR
jgi:hypothetical protein